MLMSDLFRGAIIEAYSGHIINAGRSIEEFIVRGHDGMIRKITIEETSVVTNGLDPITMSNVDITDPNNMNVRTRIGIRDPGDPSSFRYYVQMHIGCYCMMAMNPAVIDYDDGSVIIYRESHTSVPEMAIFEHVLMQILEGTDEEAKRNLMKVTAPIEFWEDFIANIVEKPHLQYTLKYIPRATSSEILGNWRRPDLNVYLIENPSDEPPKDWTL